MEYSCPTCGKATVYSTENKFRPFCSERCQLVDFGDWANEKHRITTNESVGESGHEHRSNPDTAL